MIIIVALVLIVITTTLLLVLNRNSNNNNNKQSSLDKPIILTKEEALDAQVIVIGGGPVGLVLASRLLQLNIRTIVLESRKEIEITSDMQHSKAIGIHPPSLELFSILDDKLVQQLCDTSVIVKEGVALGNGHDVVLGTLALHLCRAPFNYVLSCPQHQSENILRDVLRRAVVEYNKRNGTNLELFKTGVTVTDLKVEQNRVFVTMDSQEQITANFAVGADGKRSVVRSKCPSITYTGSEYCDTFVMGDFKDNTHYGPRAAIFLADDGLVECFPLPNGLRRWVCSTDTYIKNPSRELICNLVKNRTKYDINPEKHTMLSTFGVQGFVVNQFVETSHNRFILAGDAAHICSPLGGQGMNLGWNDAWALAQTLNNIFNSTEQDIVRSELQKYNTERMKLAKAVIHRAELNMTLGRKPKYIRLRNLFVRFCLIPIYPFQYTIASFFTMRWLGNLSIGDQYVFA
jgi:2-polyprenyl-6-methoxyphenol hydroxylase-like FAD-dependent oxidoreductase